MRPKTRKKAKNRPKKAGIFPRKTGKKGNFQENRHPDRVKPAENIGTFQGREPSDREKIRNGQQAESIPRRSRPQKQPPPGIRCRDPSENLPNLPKIIITASAERRKSGQRPPRSSHNGNGRPENGRPRSRLPSGSSDSIAKTGHRKKPQPQPAADLPRRPPAHLIYN